MAALGPHAGFIVISYVFTALVLAVLIIASVTAHRSARRRLAELSAGHEAEG